MKRAYLITVVALAVPAYAQQPPSELDIRIAALTAEYEAQGVILQRRAATLAAELAATQARLKANHEAHAKTKTTCGEPCKESSDMPVVRSRSQSATGTPAAAD